MPIDTAALEDALSSFEVRLGSARRVHTGSDDSLPLATGTATLVYVVEGEVSGDATVDSGCAVDVPGARASAMSGHRILRAGDAFLSLGRRATSLRPLSDARLMTADIELAANATARSLPDVIFVTGFAALEPAAAALAAELGPVFSGADLPRSGDPVICRMMVSTVLLSVVRAWAQAGCSPVGWPSVAHDPFLERVVSAVHDDPGRDWTLELLASAGAMSRSVFAERFRTAFGRSPVGYVADVRMQRAKDLLAAGRSVSETSRELGYASDEGFSRAFRRHTGIVPSRWRSDREAPIPA